MRLPGGWSEWKLKWHMNGLAVLGWVRQGSDRLGWAGMDWARLTRLEPARLGGANWAGRDSWVGLA